MYPEGKSERFSRTTIMYSMLLKLKKIIPVFFLLVKHRSSYIYFKIFIKIMQKSFEVVEFVMMFFSLEEQETKILAQNFWKFWQDFRNINVLNSLNHRSNVSAISIVHEESEVSR